VGYSCLLPSNTLRRIRFLCPSSPTMGRLLCHPRTLCCDHIYPTAAQTRQTKRAVPAGKDVESLPMAVRASITSRNLLHSRPVRFPRSFQCECPPLYLFFSQQENLGVADSVLLKFLE